MTTPIAEQLERRQLLSAAAVLASAVDPVSGHKYSVLSASTWTDANTAAQSQGGNLATINSSAQNDWIRQQFSTFPELWLGLKDPVGNGSYSWSSGWVGLYRKWAPGFPSAPDGNARYALLETSSGLWLNSTSPSPTTPVYGLVEFGTVIPDNGALNSTSEVKHLTGPLSSVKVTVSIRHPFIPDLSLTLVSPNGTSVLLANSVGGGGSGFVDTTFDDRAPTSIASATPPFAGAFRPIQSLSAFDGQNAMGNWTLKASDSSAGDQGTLEDWQLDLQTAPNDGPGNRVIPDRDTTPNAYDDTDFGRSSSPSVHAFTLTNTGAGYVVSGGATPVMQPDFPKHFVDQAPFVMSSSIALSGLGASITDLDVHLNILDDGALQIEPLFEASLTAPSGVAIGLFNTQDFAVHRGPRLSGTILDDQAAIDLHTAFLLNQTAPFTGRFKPMTPLSTFNGQNPNGTWTLTIVRSSFPDFSGTLLNWSLDVAAAPVTPAISIGGTDSNDFRVTRQPLLPLAPGASTTFEITFSPSAMGPRDATVMLDGLQLGGSQFTILGDGVDQPHMVVAGNSDFGSIQGTYDGGDPSLYRYESFDRTFTIRNDGVATLHLTSPIRLENLLGPSGSPDINADLFLVSFPSPVIPPGQSTTFSARFRPDAAGGYTGSIAIGSDDPALPLLLVPIGARGENSLPYGSEPPPIDAYPPINAGDAIGVSHDPLLGLEVNSPQIAPRGDGTVDFGSILSGSPLISTISITNGGTVAVALAAPQMPTGLSLIDALSNTTLMPSQSTTFSVSVDAGTIGPRAGDIIIPATRSTDGVNEQLQIHCIADVVPTASAEAHLVILDNGIPLRGDGTDLLRFSPPLPGDEAIRRTITLKDKGTAALVFSNNPPIEFAPGSDTAFAFGSQPAASIDVGQQSTFEIDDDAPQKGPHSAGVWIASNDPAAPFQFSLASGSDLVILDGAAGLPDAAIVDLGATNTGQPSVRKALVLKNYGAGEIDLSTISAPPGFIITSILPATLAGGASTTLELAIAAQPAGHPAGVLQLPRGNGAVAMLNLIGEVRPTPSGLIVALLDTRSIPAKRVAGDNVTRSVRVTLTNNSVQTFSGPVTVAISAVADPLAAGQADISLGQKTLNAMTLKPGAKKLVSIDVKLAALSPGGYLLRATPLSTSIDNPVAAARDAGSHLTIEQPIIQLTAGTAKAPRTVRLGKKFGVVVPLINTGNVTSTSSLSVHLDLVASSNESPLYSIDITDSKVSLHPGIRRAAKLWILLPSGVGAGQYFINLEIASTDARQDPVKKASVTFPILVQAG